MQGKPWKNTPSWTGSSRSQKCGLVSHESMHCRKTLQADRSEMINLAAQAIRPRNFSARAMYLAPAEIARRFFGDGATVNQTLKEGWKRGTQSSIAEDILTQAEESKLGEFWAVDSEQHQPGVAKPIGHSLSSPAMSGFR